MNRIGVIGAGAWGTALAQVARQQGRETTIWAREPEVVASINSEHRNNLYLGKVALDRDLRASTDMADLKTAELILLVTPAQHMRAVATELAPHIKAGVPLVICSKGVEKGSFDLMSDVAHETLPDNPVAVLSGPTFAIEVARGLPTAVTLACGDASLGREIVDAIGGPAFRPYLHDDVAGAQIGGAIKNVMAIACGIVAGKQMGDNARAALMTRGLAEILRYGARRGAKPETMMGLSGLGDLALTCSSPQSRNMSLGIELGKGRTMAEVLAERNSVAEGVTTAAAVTAEARANAVDMPIAQAVDGICNQAADVNSTIEALLRRPFTTEFRT
jgi:glycerol-3-phosphate dehydrogenase (NAD(P)+)